MFIEELLDHHMKGWKMLGGFVPPFEALASLKRDFRAGGSFDPSRKMQDKECFRNALCYALSKGGLHYVEGLASRRDLPLLIHHAWCIDPADPEGKAIDPTWSNPHEAEYASIIQLPANATMRRMNETGVYGLLDLGRGFDLSVIEEHDPELWAAFNQQQKEAAA